VLAPGLAGAHRTAAPQETEALAARLAIALQPGEVVLLTGELGTGKTTFVRGACRALGVAGAVTSPTFTLGRRYDGDRDGRPLAISHLDLYRLDDFAAEDPGLLADYLAPERIAFVEWPEAAAAEGALAGVVARVRLAHAGGDARKIEIEPA
jgi:tRNA threonylcarbamoyladenosine biosynthesis protein TsaE